MDLRRFEAGDRRRCRNCLPGASALSAGGLYPATAGAWANRPDASPPSVCWTAIPWWQRRRGVCWALGIWSRADIWTACIRQRTASAGVAAALCDALEAEARRQGEELLRVEASRTARGFLSGGGIRYWQPSWCRWMGEELENFRMAKKLGRTVSHETNA